LAALSVMPSTSTARAAVMTSSTIGLPICMTGEPLLGLVKGSYTDALAPVMSAMRVSPSRSSVMV